MKLKIDLTTKSGSIGNVFLENRDSLLSSTSVQQLSYRVKALFEMHKINTPKSREIAFKLSNGFRSLPQALIYVQNIIFKAQRLGV